MGTSWGQCSELCGVNHAYMPIEIKVLHFADFMYFMHLKVKEILHPYLVAVYDSRLNVILDFLKTASAVLRDRPDLFDDVSRLTNLRKIMALKDRVRL